MEKNTRYTGKTANELTPFIPTHPGAILKDEIECRGISVPWLAEDMGVECSDLEDVLNEKRPLTEKMALLLEAALDINAEPLMRMQTSYNMQTARHDRSFMEKLAMVRRVAAVL